MKNRLSRRSFLRLLPGLAAGVILARPRGAAAHVMPRPWEHPEPRPGIDGSNVLTAEELSGTPHVIEIYDGIREIPHIADGIRCHCGCADLPHTRSLLSCYEKDGMAPFCEICQGQGRLAIRRHAEGQSLDQIRRAIDARFAGSGG